METIAPLGTFAEHCTRGELAYTVDAGGQPVWPPRIDLAWRVSGGRGVVYATTTMRSRDGAARNLSLVALAEGFRMMAEVRAPAVHIGQRVAVAFDDGVPIFVPA